MQRPRVAILGLTLCTLSLAPVDARAQDAPALFGAGRQTVGFTSGYGVGHRLSGSVGDATATETVPLLPRWSIGLTDPFGEAPLRGNLDVGVEGIFMVNTEPHSGSAQGGGLFLRYNLLVWDRVVPYAAVAGGMVNLDYDLRTQADGFNFVIAGDLGFQTLLTDRVALGLGYRVQHISNAGTDSPNLAVDTSFGTIGVTYFVP